MSEFGEMNLGGKLGLTIVPCNFLSTVTSVTVDVKISVKKNDPLQVNT